VNALAARTVRAHFAAPFAAAATGVLVGAGLVASRGLIESVGPASLAFLRYAVGAAVLWPLALLGGRAQVARRDLVPVAALGVGQFGLLVLLLNWSLQTITSGRAALLFATMPLMTLVLAVAVRREAFSMSKLMGLGAALAGVALLLGQENGLPGATRGTAAPWVGEAAALASAAVGAACSLLYRPYLDRYPTLAVSAIAMAAAVAALAAPAVGDGLLDAVPRLGVGAWLAVAFIGVSSAVGYLCWLWALGHASPTRVTVFLALSPLTAAVLGAVMLGEGFAPALPVSIGLVTSGLWLAHRRMNSP
jgi:drug/metabolite transporter (DMT)-like permease